MKAILRIGGVLLAGTAAAALLVTCNVRLPGAGDGSGSGGGQLGLVLARAYTQNQSIGSTGGSLSTTDASGVNYSLEIPPGALLAESVISLTPVAGATRLPLSGGLVAALHLEPSGLELMQPAVLTITPAHDLDLAAAVSFAYAGEGGPAHRYPAARLQRPIRFVISHFSGYGVGYGLPAELPAPVATEAQYEHAAAEAATYGPDGELEVSQELTDVVENQLLSWWYEAVYPGLNAGASGSDLDAFVQAVNAFLSWQKQVYLAEDLLGLGPSSLCAAQVDTGWTLIGSGIESFRALAQERCVDHHELHQIQTLLRLERIVDLLGIGEPINLDELLGVCLKFELEVDITVERVLSAPSYDWWVSSMRTALSVPLEWTPEVGRVAGERQGPFDILSYDYEVDFGHLGDGLVCWVEHDRFDPEDDYAAVILLLPLNEANHEITDFGVLFFPVGPTVWWDWVCAYDGGTATALALWDGWAEGVLAAAIGAGDVEPYEDGLAPVYRGWTILGGEVYATRAISGSHRQTAGDGSGSLYQAASGTMTLRHTPGP